jgi:hypothetical protein
LTIPAWKPEFALPKDIEVAMMAARESRRLSEVLCQLRMEAGGLELVVAQPHLAHPGPTRLAANLKA